MGSERQSIPCSQRPQPEHHKTILIDYKEHQSRMSKDELSLTGGLELQFEDLLSQFQLQQSCKPDPRFHYPTSPFSSSEPESAVLPVS
ncbi:hypothetical protein O181_020640 [Austropuccinia psidii MF-1]|uniref:Uncharacterized protein n=1 Tax=Austropuccinia psidii MF-1 TaxID=1389203 RepID=A0A9Q3GWA6_9BASI|nr:hypothetical protein [Austropuccinia psidii MF-1]